MEYYSIKEVSDLLGISIYTLRYYEKSVSWTTSSVTPRAGGSSASLTSWS